MVRSPSSVDSIYNGPLDLLNNQSSFDNIFGIAPEMLLITARSSRAIEESDTLRSKIDKMCSLSHLYMFYNIVQLQYVGTDTYDSNQMMSDISKALSSFKIEFQLRGKFQSYPRRFVSPVYSTLTLASIRCHDFVI